MLSEGMIPPNDKEAEKAVLGAILLNPNALSVVAIILTEEHFYYEAHRRIFSAMGDLDRGGVEIDAVTLGSELKRRNDLDKVGGAMVFSALLNAVATSANVERYAKIVREKAAIRSMIHAAQNVVAGGFNAPADAAEYLAEARSSVISSAASLYSSKGPLVVKDGLGEVHEELIQGEEPKGLIKTGMSEIDETTGGLWPGLLTVCAARPGMGKSAFALNVATNAALAGKKVLYITLEDVRKFVILRAVARFADMNLQKLILRNVKNDEHRKLMDAMNRIHELPLWIDDSAGLTSAMIAQIAASHMNLHGLDMLVIDHLGHVADTGDKFYEVISKAARAFSDLAKDLDIPVLLMAQLSRAVEGRTDKRPMLSDLRDSGKIEEVARFVWFLYRPAYYTDNPDVRHIMKLIIAKASHGITGTVDLWNDLSRMYVRDWDDAVDGPLHADDAPYGGDEQKQYRPRKNKESFFGTGAGAQQSWEESRDKDDY